MYIWLLIWLKRTRVVWSLVISSASSFSPDFQRLLFYSCLFSFIVKTRSDQPGKAIYLPTPHSPTHPETSPPDSVSGWPPRQTLWVPLSWYSYSCVFSTHISRGGAYESAFNQQLKTRTTLPGTKVHVTYNPSYWNGYDPTDVCICSNRDDRKLRRTMNLLQQ